MTLREVEFDTDRNRLLANFSSRFEWIPHWGAEVTTAVEGLEAQIEEVDRFAGSLAIISTLADAERYRAEAQAEINDLQTASPRNKGIYPVRFEAIHSHDVVVGAMARHLLFRDALKRDKWPAHTQPRFDRKVKPYRRLVRDLSSSRRVSLWYESLESESLRNLHWVGVLLNAHTHPKVMDAIAAQKTAEEPVAETA